ncbi:MAG: hypothetical protein ILO42_07270 [Clostridia bacterium]|nr:hypothetical protein [Clostridia bacterium]
MKKRLPVIALFVLSLFLLASCGGNEIGADTGTGTVADTTSAVPEEKRIVTFLSEGDAHGYIVVRRDGAGADEVNAVTSFVRSLEKRFGVRLDYTTDWDRNPMRRDKEIVIGIFDGGVADLPGREMLGPEAFAACVSGEKLIISAGDAVSLDIAADMILDLIDRGNGKLEQPEGWSLSYSQSARFNGLMIQGRSIDEYRLEIYDSEYFANAAEEIRSSVFRCCGRLLEYGTEGKLLRLRLDKDAPSKASLIFEGDNIVVKAGTRVGLFRAVERLIAGPVEEFAAQHPNTSDAVLEANTVDFGEFVTYEDYGAVGDGEHDDLDAIIAAHDAANLKGIPVLSRENAVYYIGGAAKVAKIATDTDWSVSRFVIDDRDVENYRLNVFSVPASYQATHPAVGPLAAGAANVGFAPGYPAFILLYNANVKQYIRQGLNQDSGAAMTDVILVDAEGNVDPSTPILWDFETVTSCNAVRCDEVPITLRGGIFTTVANAGTASSYYCRGIGISRSNTVVDSLTHLITGEGSVGQSYSGFLNVYDCNNVTVKNTVLTGHKTYTKMGSAGSPVTQGTYDLLVTECTSFTALDCSQTNDINNNTYWGVFASNYAKNIRFERCVFSRFDAHKGVCNVTLIGCSLGHQGINLIGHGTARIEDCRVYGTYLVNLRSDYGSTWNGDLLIIGCDYYPYNGKSRKPIIINGSNDGTHDFGYECTLPSYIEIDSLTVHDSSSDSDPVVFSDLNPNYRTAMRPIRMPDKIVVTNFRSTSGHAIRLANTPEMFPGVELNVGQ